MRDKLNKLLDPNISKKEEDQILEDVIKMKHDEALKTKWRGVLSNKYDITRNENNSNKTIKFSNTLKIILATAACISILLTIQFFGASSNPSDLAQQYLNEQEILHPGASKGFEKRDENRTLAIQAFNNGDYDKSSKYFQSIETINDEDLYYEGLAFLLNSKYTQAIQKLETIESNERFKQELNWYLSLAYILDKQNEKAEKQLKQISSTDWNYLHAQELLKTLNE